VKIYTKTGDHGSSSLIGGKRLPKNHIRFEAYGTIDELNSYIGLLGSQSIEFSIKEDLKKIQNILFTIGSNLASDNPDVSENLPKVSEKDIDYLEKQIDLFEKNLPTMTKFILPGGNSVVGICHVARSICRRAERKIVELMQNESVEDQIPMYINRLSDFLFVLSRKLSKYFKLEEITWEK
jgi:cob(I)alamin adenosyltransferase